MADEHANALSLLSLQYSSTATQPQLPLALVHSDCPYTLHHLLACFARRRHIWRVLTHAAATPSLVHSAVLWVDEYETLDWGCALSPPYRLLNNFCIRKSLGRKANLSLALAAYLQRHPTLAATLGPSIPQTIVLDLYSAFHTRPAWLDARSALAEALFEAEEALASAPPGAAWILKPSLTNKGAGIVIVHSMEEVQAEVCREREVGQWVLQRYCGQGLLLLPVAGSPGGHKFHVRLYAAAVGALEVHVFREALLLLAPEPYTQDTACRAAHITNTCVSAASAHFAEALHVRCLSELPGMLQQQGGGGGSSSSAAVAALFSHMCRLVAHCFAAMEGKSAGFMPLPLAWELYGVDFLVVAEEGGGGGWRPVLLEFNPTPDVRQTGDRLDGLIGHLLEGVLQLALDERVRVAAGEEEGGEGLLVAPGEGAPGVRVRTSVRDLGQGVQLENGIVPLHQLPLWYPGCSGAQLPVQLPEREAGSGSGSGSGMQHHPSGFDCVYTKYWPAAHQSSVRVQ